MPCTYEEKDYYVRRLYQFLREGHSIALTKTRGYVGEITYPFEDDTAHVKLDFRRDIISTLIHEFLHHIHPEWSESDILRAESRLINSLSERQVRNIIKRFAEAL
jgi:beta-galactosidase GanA